MQELQYKTRGNSSIHGKDMLYFACHPDDFEKYFDKISADILEKQNCVVWYDKNLEKVWDEQLIADLSRMRLFVIVVTEKLLCTENRIMEKELAFALEKHIPVLPILVDISLEKEFSQAFGTMQWLNPFDEDPTAISYEKKLEKFLSGIFLGEELIERIRQEFSAYIFFSYRKKDRKYAYDVMRKIHDHSSFLDIAIWYDEYLVPGEKFDERIAQAMEKSDVFVMMVTPNLVNEKNYVMDKEYPSAKELGAEIVPIEVEETDVQLLQKHYVGIPEVIKLEETSRINSRIHDILSKKLPKKSYSIAKRQYYMGLAYLTGVDVEIDYIRATRLLIEAANSGYIEAMKKLAFMYENGEAVERNVIMAVLWQRNVVSQMEKAYQKNINEEDGIKLIEQMRKLADLLCVESGNTNEAKEVLDKCITYAKEMDSELGKRILAYSYIDGSNLCSRDQEKKDLLVKAFGLVEEMQKRNPKSDDKELLATCYEKLGHIMESDHEYQAALVYYRDALKLYKENIQKEEREATRLRLITGHLNVAKCFIKLNLWNDAEESLTVGSSLLGDLAREFDGFHIKRLQNEYLMVSSEFYEMSGEISEALKCLMEAEEVAEKLMQKRESKETLFDYARITLRLADFCTKHSREEAKSFYSKGLDAMEKSLKIKHRNGLDISHLMEYLKKAAAYEEDGDIERAEWIFEQTTDVILAEKVKSEYEGIYFRFSEMCYSYGYYYIQSGDYLKAQFYFKKASDIGEKLVEIKDTEENMQMLVNAYKGRAHAGWLERHFQDSMYYFEKAASLFMKLYNLTHKQEYQKEYERSMFYYGKCAHILGDSLHKSGALWMAEQQFSIEIEAYLKIDVDPKDLADAYECLAEVVWDQGHYGYAKLNFEGAVEVLEPTLDGDVESKLDTYRTMIRLHSRIADCESEFQFGVKIFAVREVGYAENYALLVAKATGAKDDYEVLAAIHYQAYEINKSVGDEQGAEEEYKAYKEICNMIYGE